MTYGLIDELTGLANGTDTRVRGALGELLTASAISKRAELIEAVIDRIDREVPFEAARLVNYTSAYDHEYGDEADGFDVRIIARSELTEAVGNARDADAEAREMIRSGDDPKEARDWAAVENGVAGAIARAHDAVLLLAAHLADLPTPPDGDDDPDDEEVTRAEREAAAVARLIAGEATDADRRLIGNNPDNVPDAWDWGDEAGDPDPEPDGDDDPEPSPPRLPEYQQRIDHALSVGEAIHYVYEDGLTACTETDDGDDVIWSDANDEITCPECRSEIGIDGPLDGDDPPSGRQRQRAFTARPDISDAVGEAHETLALYAPDALAAEAVAEADAAVAAAEGVLEIARRDATGTLDVDAAEEALRAACDGLARAEEHHATVVADHGDTWAADVGTFAAADWRTASPAELGAGGGCSGCGFSIHACQCNRPSPPLTDDEGRLNLGAVDRLWSSERS